MKTLASLCLLLGLLGTSPAQAQERDGSFTIRFEPVVKLQSGVEIPFQITVMDPRQKAVEHATVKLQIKDHDNMNVRDFKSIMISSGVYLAKPTFSSAGEWSVSVEVRREGEMTARTIQFTVAE